MNDFAAVQDIPIDVNSGTIPDALPNQAMTPDKPQPQANEASIQPKENKEPVAKSAREAIEKAAAKVEAAEKPKTETTQPRAETGKFASKEVAAQPMQPTAAQEQPPQVAQPERAASKYEAPARFSEAARNEWQRAPESVQAEVARVLKENEDGITKYKSSHESWERVRNFDEIAKQNGVEGVHKSLEKMVDLENTFSRNPIEGFQKVAQHFGLNLEAVAAHIMGQNPNQQVAQVHEQVKQLQQENALLKQQIEAPNQVASFRTDFGEAEFDAIADDIVELLETGVAHDLKSAAVMAKMLNRRSASNASDAGAQTATMPAAQTGAPVTAQTGTMAERQPNPAGQKSVTGAPGSTPINPTASKPSGRSVREAILNAAARA